MSGVESHSSDGAGDENDAMRYWKGENAGRLREINRLIEEYARANDLVLSDEMLTDWIIVGGTRDIDPEQGGAVFSLTSEVTPVWIAKGLLVDQLDRMRFMVPMECSGSEEG